MKARIEKKLSKRLVEIAPTIFKDVWIDKDFSDLAYEQCTRVSHIPSVGGGIDYWGEGVDVFTCWASWRTDWMWCGDFKPYPQGHEHEHLPNTERFRPTTQNLLKLAARCEARSQGAQP